MPQFIANKPANDRRQTVNAMSATQRRLQFTQRSGRPQSAPDHNDSHNSLLHKSLESLNAVASTRARFASIGRSVDDCHRLTEVSGNNNDVQSNPLHRLFNSDMFNVFFSLAKDNIPSPNISLSVANSSRDQLIATVHNQYRALARLLEPYRRLKNALKKLQDGYLDSKEHSVFQRYAEMRMMVHEVVSLERQYWQLIDLPKQSVSETPGEYVLRVVSLLEEKSTQPIKQGAIASLLGATINIAERTKDQSLYESIRSKSTEELRRECEHLNTELYRLIHKYQGLRLIVQELSESFQDSRLYPILPRYSLLKAMIKRVLRAPAFAEVCHEPYE